MTGKHLEIIKSTDDYLSARETALIRRERDLAERADRLQQETDKFFEEKTEFLDKKLQNQAQSIDGIVETRISQDIAKKELAAKNEQITDIKEELKYLRKQLEQGIALSHKKDEKTLMDKLMPFMPSVITVVGMFLMSKKFDPNNDQDPVQKEINNVFKSIDPKNRETLTKALRDAIGNYSAVVNKDDQNNDHKSDQKEK
jgi:glycerophosphoryl diester phosphodiesterase